MTRSQPALPTNRAFVLQFHAQADAMSPRDQGRVEHLASGQATHFQSWAELREFIEQVLASVHDQEGESPQ